MIVKLPESKGATVGFKVSERVDLDQEHYAIDVCNELLKEYQKINLVVVIDGKINFGVDVFYADLKWIFAHIKNMNKLAIVSDSQVLKWLVAMDSPFGKLVGISEKHFETEKLENAWQWVNE